ncbi:peptidylprolyl isomerase fpr3 [Marasmius tenuissimus]|uniref:Peptidylprolyl isomerase fpr3 n=1 Tax=Marasmius tenuissimus TaxID=585030 RepID=A0ABR2ZUK6_9AGAR
MAYWSAIIHPGFPLKITPERTLVLTNAALGNKVVDFTSHTSLFVHQTGVMGGYGAIASLMVGRIESYSFQVRLTAEAEFVVEVEGKNSVSVIGYYKSGTHIDSHQTNPELITDIAAVAAPVNKPDDGKKRKRKDEDSDKPDDSKKKKRKEGEDPDKPDDKKRKRKDGEDPDKKRRGERDTNKRAREDSDADADAGPSNKKARLTAN